MSRLPRARECGACTACCTLLGVDEIAKPAKQRCEHLKPRGGCGVYAVRPGSCADYRCAWLAGVIRLERHRPDRLGLMFDQADSEASRKLAGVAGDAWLIARELWPGAAASGEAARVLAALATQGLILLDRWNGRTQGNLRGPEELVRAAQAARGEVPA